MATQAKAVEPTILFEHDPTLLTSVIQVVVRTGAADDPADKIGVAQLMSELVLRGTKKKSRSAFQSEIERMGGLLTVRTQHDMTVIVGKVIQENTVALLKLIEETLLTPAFNEKEFAALKTEQLGEIAYYKNNNTRLGGLAMRKEIFAGTSLERPTVGSLSTVKSITRDDVLKAYNNAFNRANMVFAVASPIKEADIKGLIKEMWLKFPDGFRRAPRSIEPKYPNKTQLIVIHKPDTSTGSIVMSQPGIVAQDTARYALQVGNFSFGAEPLVSKLFRIIRSELGWTYSIGSTYSAMGALSYQKGMYLISATPSVEFTTKTILKSLALWNEYKNNAPSKEDMALAHDSLVNSYPFEFDSAEKRLWQRLYSYLYDVPLLNPEQYTKKITGISGEDVKKAVKDRHSVDRWLIAVVADQKVVEQQLKDEQKDVPADKQLTITKVITPDSLIE